MFGKAKRYGLIPNTPRPADWRFGGLTGLDATVLREDGQWDSYLPVYEPQSNIYFDTMACVTFSAINCIETLAYRRYGVQLNLADRFTAKMSGTTAQGNTFSAVADSLRKDGSPDDGDWPFLPFLKTFADYYAEVPEQVKAKAKTLLEHYKISYEFVWDTPDRMMEALKCAPLQVAIHAYGPLEGDVYTRTMNPGNHAVELYGYEAGQYWKVYDHYDNKFKKLAWDTIFHGAVRYDIVKLPETSPMVQFKPNTLYQVVEGPGEFLLFIAGKMRRDDISKLLASWMVVNSGNTSGMVGTLTLKDIEGVEIFNLKGEKV